MNTDITIIGAGIVGLATAYQLSRQRPDLKILVIEKEDGVARHQTGHNSGVIHSGIYYKPGGTKAVHCLEGYRLLLQFCEAQGVPYELCGKLIVATREAERPLLRNILERGKANGMQGLQLLNEAQTREKEPHVAGVESIWVPQAGIVSYKRVAEKYLELLRAAGSDALFNAKVTGIRQQQGRNIVYTTQGDIEARLVIGCAGLYSDKITGMTMPDQKIKILPFRGEYYKLVPEKEYLVNHLIYPVPNPRFPFLGVHYTRMIEGGIEAGPNAVLAFKREGYSRWDFRPDELLETLTYPGFQRIAARYWRDGLGELYRSYSKRAFVRALQHLIPEIGEADLQRGGSGVRAMACNPQGELIDDFLIFEKEGVINVANAPSPAATASLAIGNTVAARALKRWAADG